MKKLSGLIIGVGILATQACTQETTDLDQVDSVDQGYACFTQQGIKPMQAALAVAMANEIGELDPVRDLTIDYGARKVLLSNEGNNRCNAHGGCTNTQAILDMQNSAVNDVIPQEMFNATSFREVMVTSLQDQINYENDLRRNNPSALPEPHALTQSSVANYGACGVHYVFDVTKANCTPSSGGSSSGGSCDGLRTWQGNDWQFTVQQGEVIQYNGVRYQANQYIGYPNGECAPDHPASWCSSWFTNLGACGSSSGSSSSSGDSCSMDHPERIANRLYTFGGQEANEYIDFRSTDSTIAIDPTGTMNGGGGDSSGSCTAGATAFDPTYALAGTCCTVNGRYGTFQSASFNPRIFLCRF